MSTNVKTIIFGENGFANKHYVSGRFNKNESFILKGTVSLNNEKKKKDCYVVKLSNDLKIPGITSFK